MVNLKLCTLHHTTSLHTHTRFHAGSSSQNPLPLLHATISFMTFLFPFHLFTGPNLLTKTINTAHLYMSLCNVLCDTKRVQSTQPVMVMMDILRNGMLSGRQQSRKPKPRNSAERIPLLHGRARIDTLALALPNTPENVNGGAAAAGSLCGHHSEKNNAIKIDFIFC